ncbi:MAG TPA: winged helix-turn-helix domain-containing protein [Sphingobium sp.]|uniref:winged helix-turn-helix domain-containing protein n=1 Tax=Sphingobium sp. TaxID=1912891 RepID=UPI002ECFE3DF
MAHDRILDLLSACEARLQDTVRTASEALEAIRIAREEMLTRSDGDLPLPSTETPATSWRDDLVQQVLAALKDAPARGVDPGARQTLNYRKEDQSYGVGRRRMSLTETERHILDIFWQAMPEPVSREMILTTLYRHGDKPGAGAIDVFVSKLRQKLKLASNGQEFLESVRGKGWALRPELCQPADGDERGPVG